MARRHKSLVIFILVVVGIGWAIGATNLPGAWYAGLQKPPFNPPNWVFAPTWTLRNDRGGGLADLFAGMA